MIEIRQTNSVMKNEESVPQPMLSINVDLSDSDRLVDNKLNMKQGKGVEVPTEDLLKLPFDALSSIMMFLTAKEVDQSMKLLSKKLRYV